MNTTDKTGKCPNCSKELPRFPGKKMNCPFCQEDIYPRTKPLTKEKVLVTKEGLKEIEDEWTNYALSSKWFKLLEDFGITKEDFLKRQEQLREKFGFFPFINDVFWGLFNDLTLDCLKEKDMKKYQEVKEIMERFKEEEK